MELHIIIIGAISALVGLLGIFGWSHKSLRQRMDRMELEGHSKPSFSNVRMVMADKLAPLQSEYNSLTTRIEDLKLENHKLNDKVDRLLVICTKLSYAKEDI